MLVSAPSPKRTSMQQFIHRFETRSFPISLVAYPRDFAFYVADPISSIHRFSQIINKSGNQEVRKKSIAGPAHPFNLLNFYFVLLFGIHRLTRRTYASYSSPKVRRKVGSSYKTTNRCVARKKTPA